MCEEGVFQAEETESAKKNREFARTVGKAARRILKLRTSEELTFVLCCKFPTGVHCGSTQLFSSPQICYLGNHEGCKILWRKGQSCFNCSLTLQQGIFLL